MLWPELQVDSSVNTQVYRNKHRAQGLRTMKFLTLVSRMYGILLNTSSSTRVDARRQRALSEGSAMALVLPVPSSLLCLPYQPGSGCFKEKKKKKRQETNCSCVAPETRGSEQLSPCFHNLQTSCVCHHWVQSTQHFLSAVCYSGQLEKATESPAAPEKTSFNTTICKTACLYCLHSACTLRKHT